MAIDLTTQRGLNLKQAAKLIPSCRDDRPTHISRLVRWITRGVKDQNGAIVKLEALRLGGQWITTAEAVQAFAERLTPSLSESAESRTSKGRRKAAERADAELTKIGF
jgi:hypothetical protein